MTKHLLSDSFGETILMDINPDMDYLKSIIDENMNKVRVVKGSILDEVLVEKVISDYQIDSIIHTAAINPVKLIGTHYEKLLWK